MYQSSKTNPVLIQYVTFKVANSQAEFESGKELFREYALSLNVDLSFQNFSKELETIHEQYCVSEGALLLACIGDEFIGCSGIRKFDSKTAELKRMYVKDSYRGLKVGAQLLEHSIGIAQKLGYEKMRLDTLENMVKAQQLYRAFGFYEIPAYRFNPLPGTIYMEKEL